MKFLPDADAPPQAWVKSRTALRVVFPIRATDEACEMTGSFPLHEPGPAAAGASRTFHLAGEAGRIELLLDRPAQPVRGVVPITHPQPVLGGSPRHRMPHRFARMTQALGWLRGAAGLSRRGRQ